MCHVWMWDNTFVHAKQIRHESHVLFRIYAAVGIMNPDMLRLSWDEMKSDWICA
jgi:hypothetical protein